METKITKEPVYKVEKIKTGEIEKITYVTKDGKEWISEPDAKKHEKSLEVMEKCDNDFKEVTVDGFRAELIEILFSGYHVSSPMILKWTVPPYQDDKLAGIIDYLKVKAGRSINSKVLFNSETQKVYNDGEEVLIGMWIEDEDTDYPSYSNESILYSEALRRVDDFFNKIKDSLTKV